MTSEVAGPSFEINQKGLTMRSFEPVTRPEKSQTRYAPILGFILASALSGCATSDKCQSAGCSDDAKITTAVQANFQQHAELGAPNDIQVQTINHVVYLHGTVSAGQQSAEAVSVAQQTPGVKRVVSDIAISH